MKKLNLVETFRPINLRKLKKPVAICISLLFIISMISFLATIPVQARTIGQWSFQRQPYQPYYTRTPNPTATPTPTPVSVVTPTPTPNSIVTPNLTLNPTPISSPTSAPTSTFSGNNLAVMPTFWENSGWGIGSSIAPSMDTYPVTYGGQTAIQMSPNANYISTGDGGGVADCELDGGYVSVSPGDQIYFSAYIWTGSSTVGDNGNALLGGRIALDFYGAKGRICEIATPTGIPSYPNYPASMAQCTVSPNSNGWVKVTIDFTVQSQYEADGFTAGYTAGTMATPSAFVPWFASFSSNVYAETASMWIYDTVLYVTTP